MSNKFKVFCNRCNTMTNHSEVCEHVSNEIVEVDNEGVIEKHHLGSSTYQVVKCDGCEAVSFRSLDYFPNFLSFDEETSKPIFSQTKTFEKIYPERLNNSLSEKRIIELPSNIRKVYREVIDSYNYDLRILCAAGLRSIVEAVCVHFKLKAKPLQAGIDKLSEIGLIGKDLAKSLVAHKSLGNNAVHRLDAPEREELKTAIHLIEVTLESVFGVPGHHQRLNEMIGKRLSKE